MKNLLNMEDNKEMVGRISSVSISDRPLWGKMNVSEMLVHLADQIRIGLGTKETKFVGNAISTSIAKYAVLLGVPAPKGKVNTVPELKQGAGGSKTVGFDQDKKTLIDMVNDFSKSHGADTFREHPYFGNLSKKQWGRLAYIHINHHLKQFGR